MATQLAKIGAERTSLIERTAQRFGVDANKMLQTLKATAFRAEREVTNEQMMALLVVADQYDLNPWTKEIYAFPDKKNGIIPVVGIDGWSRIINSNSAFDGMEFIESEEIVDSAEHKPCPAWIECVIYRKDRRHPIRVRERLAECYRPPFKGQYGPVIGPWQTHTSRFLRHKAMLQCARVAFGFVGIFDQDEAERIREAETMRIEETPRIPKRNAKQSLDAFAGATVAEPTRAKNQRYLEADTDSDLGAACEDAGVAMSEELNDDNPYTEG
jgi:phage recombination protein Bet